MIYCIDVDGTICTLTEETNYYHAEPKKEMIKKINRLYKMGNIIKIFTARGQDSGEDYKSLTEFQLDQWGVKYHELIMGKPSADYYVDDKALLPHDFVSIY